MESNELYQGAFTNVYVRGYAADGRRVNVDAAVVTSSDPALASLISRSLFQWDGATAVKYGMTTPGSGNVVLRASMAGLNTDSVIRVIPLPPVASSVVIDSFTVVEYRVNCAWECPYLAYAPLLKLREATGQSRIYVTNVQITISTQSSSFCSVGPLLLEPGFDGQINSIKDYLWDNDMLLVQLDGKPLPPGEASARIIFRDAQGKAGMAEATGIIQRMVENPVFPPGRFQDTGWYCPFSAG